MGNEVSGQSRTIAFERGDVIRRKFINYDQSDTEGVIGFHYGIYIGNNRVIHLYSDGFHKCSLEEFSHGNKVSKYE